MIFRYFRPLRWDNRKGVYQPLKNGGIAFAFEKTASGHNVRFKMVSLTEPFNRDELRDRLLHSDTNFSLPVESIGLTEEVIESIITFINTATETNEFAPLAKLMSRVIELNEAERQRVQTKMNRYRDLRETFINQLYTKES
jgi:hypothetical protein